MRKPFIRSCLFKFPCTEDLIGFSLANFVRRFSRSFSEGAYLRKLQVFCAYSGLGTENVVEGVVA